MPKNVSFNYKDEVLEIVKFSFKYLGKVFIVGRSFSEIQTTLPGQAQKAILKLNKNVYKFTFISPEHKVDLFYILISPILNYSCEVWGFFQANTIEQVHLEFCKNTTGCKEEDTKQICLWQISTSKLCYENTLFNYKILV